MSPERAGGGRAEDVVEAVRLGTNRGPPGGRNGCRRDEDFHLRPVGPDRADEAAQKRPDLNAPRRLAGRRTAVAIGGRHRRRHRLDPLFVVMGVEQAQLLVSPPRRRGVVEIQRDAPRDGVTSRPVID